MPLRPALERRRCALATFASVVAIAATVGAATTARPRPTPTVTPHNRLPKLVPATGGWRGSTLGDASLAHGSPAQYKTVYGHELHLYRSFKTPESSDITAAERAFVRAGGILWYNMQPSNWSSTLTPEFGSTIARFAAAVKTLAPMQVIVNAGHEPDGHCDPTNKNKPYYGSPDEFRAMWFHFRSVFSAAGVDNAVWAMDYSRNIHKPQTFEKFAGALWPGDGAVDWLFFNAFGDHPIEDSRGNWTEIVGSIYRNFESSAVAPGGHNYTAIPWGLGAFQPKPPPMMNESDRTEYITLAAEALNESTFPRLRALVYYDHDSSGMGADYLPAYKRYLSSPFFTANDANEA